MKQFAVWGTVACSVCVVVEAEDEDDALKVADEMFGGLTQYLGNGGTDKIIGVSGPNESIDPGDYVEWESADEV